jgi:hypothetical protein
MAQATIGRRATVGRADRTQSGIAVEVSGSVRALGFWAAAATAITYLVFELGVIGGKDMLKLLPIPWDVYIPIGASLLIAPSFLLLTIAIHYSAPESKRVWTHAGVAFATIYAALVSLVYVTWLFVVEPQVINHTESAVAPFTFAQGSFIQMVDGLGYTFMGVAAVFTAPAVGGDRLGRWIRSLAIANGPAAALVLLSYITFAIIYGVPTAILFPAYAILLAIRFYRARAAAE